jgi:hypothetical protein
MKTKTLSLIALTLVLGLSACASATIAESTDQTGQLAAIDFAQVEVGLGSPTPVTVTVDVSYSSTCTQFSQISQEIVEEGERTRIKIEVRTSEMGRLCTQAALSFRMVLPINAVALSKGVYSVEVNGVDAGSFEFQN